MTIHFPAVAACLLVPVAAASAAELPSFEVSGFPVSRLQVQVLGSARVEERSATPTLTGNGMPATPHQIAALSHRHKVKVGVLAASGRHD